MAFTYDEALGNALSQVRFLIGDTIETGAMFTDAAINGAIAFMDDDVYEAAASLADQLAARYSSSSSISIDGLNVNFGEKAKAYNDLAVRLRSQNTDENNIGDPFVGGVSVSDMRAVNSDTDRPPNAFGVLPRSTKSELLGD